LQRALSEKRYLLGTLITMASPALAEALSSSPLDWLFFDLEHSTLDLATVQAMIQATHPRCLTFIRVAEPSAVRVQRALDTGCDGVIVPQVNSREAAQAVANAGKFPPLGRRSIGLSRALGYGYDLADRVGHANEQTSLLVQIEDRDAVANVDAIVSVQGIDGVFVGPYDLSASLGQPGNLAGEPLHAAIDLTLRSARAQGKIAGIFAAGEAAARAEIARGFTLVAVGADIARLRASVESTAYSLNTK
jgi:2-keto-3-deoxy-L-rhamnonate aldolase RhmA